MWEAVFLGMFIITLGYAVWEDIHYQCVRRLVWWINGCSALLLFQVRMSSRWEVTWYGFAEEIVPYWCLQFLIFSKMYGRADCHAFVCCAVALSSFGGGMREYLVHMLCSVILLGIVQAVRKNINRQGNLYEPVAFIPYITMGWSVVMGFLMYRNEWVPSLT